MGEERSVLRLGGIGALFYLAATLVTVGVIALLPPFLGPFESSEELLQGILAYRTHFLLLTGLNLLALGPFLPFMLALWRALRKTSPAFALLGSVLGAIGIAVLNLGAAVFYLSELALATVYAVAAPQDAMMVVIAHKATATVFLSVDRVGLLLLGAAYFALGVAMLGSSDFHKGHGWAGIILGLIYVGGGLIRSEAAVDPLVLLGLVAAAFLVALPLFLGSVGWKLYSLSRAPGVG